MLYYVSKKNKTKRGTGTSEDPFRTIGQAAEIARAGDRIIIGDGIYREWVSPRYGGTSEHERITYIAAQGAKPVISGAEEVTGWEQTSRGLWKKEIDNSFFGSYNPFADVLHGDWYDDLGKEHHTGEVYIDGESLYEEDSVTALTQPAPSGRELRWYAEVSEESTIIWCNFQERDPNAALVEVNVRPFCFFPESEGINYITVSGLWLRQAATQWAPPTAFQTGALGTHWSKGWIIESCTVSHSKCSGISVGKRRQATDNAWSRNHQKGGAQAQMEVIFQNLKDGWSRERVGSHVIRNNHIYSCGQTGIVGNMGGAFSLIEGNYIHDINIRKEFEGFEIAGIKLHAAIDTVIRGNCIHDCNRGIWIDWEAQGARITQNIIFRNAWQDLFYEVCHGPCLIDNNIFLSHTNMLNISQGAAIVHNFFAGRLKMRRETSRFTPYHLPHDTFVGGVMMIYGGDDHVAGNIFLGQGDEAQESGTFGYDACPDVSEGWIRQEDDRPAVYADNMLPVNIHDNLYLGGARQYRKERDAEVRADKVYLEIRQQDGVYVLKTNLFDCGWGKKADIITSEKLGFAFESGARFENADGSDIVVDNDFKGRKRKNRQVYVGPFEEGFTELQMIPFHLKS